MRELQVSKEGPYWKESHKNKKDKCFSIVAALRATLDTLVSLDVLSDPLWIKLKNRLQVSFVKETKKPNEVNTSLTSGIAFKRLEPGQTIGI